MDFLEAMWGPAPIPTFVGFVAATLQIRKCLLGKERRPSRHGKRSAKRRK